VGIVLVTGATGTVGAHVLRGLREAGEDARGAARDPRGRPHLVRFDLGDPSTWDEALQGVDRLFLMRPPAVSDVGRVMGPFVRAAAPRLRGAVFLSVMGVNPALPHWRVERMLRRLGVPHVNVRPAFFMQNLTGPYRRDIAGRGLLRFPAGRGRTAFVDARDVAEVAVRALLDPAAHAGRHPTLTGPEAVGWQEVAGLLSAALGRPVRYETTGPLRHRRDLIAAGAEPAYANVQLAIHLTCRLGLAARRTPDLGRCLGRPPRRLGAFIAEHAGVWAG
jgi:uncharacterized protein YbjT (DUF2867 family)